MSPKDALTLKAANLAQVAFQEWKEFLAAFEMYAAAKMGECVAAPVEQVQVAQGRAQNSVELNDLLKGAVVSASRIAKRAEPKL